MIFRVRSQRFRVGNGPGVISPTAAVSPYPWGMSTLRERHELEQQREAAREVYGRSGYDTAHAEGVEAVVAWLLSEAGAPVSGGDVSVGRERVRALDEHDAAVAASGAFCRDAVYWGAVAETLSWAMRRDGVYAPVLA